MIHELSKADLKRALIIILTIISFYLFNTIFEMLAWANYMQLGDFSN